MRVWALGVALLAFPLVACAESVESQTVKQTDTARLQEAAPSHNHVAAHETLLEAEKHQETNSATTIPKMGPVPITCYGIAEQGGLVVCRTEPNAQVKIARAEDDFYFETSDENGILFVGFDRDEATNFIEHAGNRVTFELKPRDYDTSRIDGLPKNMVNEYTPEELKRIRAASAKKKIGFASRVQPVGFKDGFIYPIQEDYIKTTNFGAQRILNGVPKKPHYGVDLAAPKGTPIVAPADGIVSLASEDMYFEGALILIDHGQGLISYYLHMDDVMVEDGQAVKQGEQIATVGSKGRSTGPHLCWRLKWRNRNLDPELLTQWSQD
ncbi:peptidase M23-like protein [Litorimonas taeanensis]|uniref:Peptidase M23-like protein n=1 Tax=Litorimonas taeanensis TaxID=568099 RepID=A0A420WDM6_9PROT|nr:M23 family metallopeptidase [Litorimonas taeanensis]RKQ69111.1 peptidase M23-like protein [Litorimonas taeanensis]